MIYAYSHFGPAEKENRLLNLETPETQRQTEGAELNERQESPEAAANDLINQAAAEGANTQATIHQAAARHPEVAHNPQVQVAELAVHNALGISDQTQVPVGETETTKGVEENPKGNPEKGGENPEEAKKQPEVEPKTNGERIDRDMKKADATLRNPEAKGWEKLGAAIMMLLLIIERIRTQIAGKLDDPIEKKNDATEGGTDEANEQTATGSEDKVDQQKRLQAEVAVHPGGIDGLIAEKKQKLEQAHNSGDTRIDDMDRKIGDLKIRKLSIQNQIDGQRQAISDAEQALAKSPDAETKAVLEGQIAKANESIRDLEIDLRGTEEKIAANERNRAELVGKGGNEDVKKLQEEVDALTAMKEKAEKDLTMLKTNMILAATELGRQLGGRIPFLRDLQTKLTVELDPKTLQPYVSVREDLRGDLVSSVTEKGSAEEAKLTEDLADGKLDDVAALTTMLENVKKEVKPS